MENKNSNVGCAVFLQLIFLLVVLYGITFIATKQNPHNIKFSGTIFDKHLISGFPYMRFNTNFDYRIYIIDENNVVQEIPVTQEDYFKTNLNDKLKFECIVGGSNTAYQEKCKIIYD